MSSFPSSCLFSREKEKLTALVFVSEQHSFVFQFFWSKLLTNKISRKEFGPMLQWHRNSPTMSMKCILRQTKLIDPPHATVWSAANGSVIDENKRRRDWMESLWKAAHFTSEILNIGLKGLNPWICPICSEIYLSSFKVLHKEVGILHSS